jgi:hypothetical protein
MKRNAEAKCFLEAKRFRTNCEERTRPAIESSSTVAVDKVVHLRHWGNTIILTLLCCTSSFYIVFYVNTKVCPLEVVINTTWTYGVPELGLMSTYFPHNFITSGANVPEPIESE